MEILIKDISKSYGEHIVLRDINFDIQKGDIVLIYGKNGSGKTTLLKILNLLEVPDAGEIVYIDSGVYYFRSGVRRNYMVQRKMVFIPQKPVIFSGSVMDNILIGLKLRNSCIDEKRIEYLMQEFDIHHIKEKVANQVSSGQKQKISIVRSFILDCQIILLDEPLNYLDDQGKQYLKNCILEKVINGVSFVITTPDLKQWEDFLFNKTYLLKEGYLYDISSKGKKYNMEYCQGSAFRKNSTAGLSGQGHC